MFVRMDSKTFAIYLSNLMQVMS